MSAGARLVTAGAVGKPHGLDGSFAVERAEHPLEEGTLVRLGGRERRIERRAGTEERPLVRVAGVADRDAAVALRGELLLIEDTLAADEWLAEDLVGCHVEGMGTVRRVMDGPSCDVLELDGGELVPLIRDAITCVDLKRRLIEVDRDFLALSEGGRR
jgi:16S rRNA processing protein RimM